MRIDPDAICESCPNDPAVALLAAEVRRLRSVIAAGVTTIADDDRTPQAHATPGECSVPRNGAVAACETVCPHIRGTVTQHCSLNFTLTNEERAAILTAADLLIGSKPGVILRHLLARLS
jgi:hypothetical protein